MTLIDRVLPFSKHKLMFVIRSYRQYRILYNCFLLQWEDYHYSSIDYVHCTQEVDKIKCSPSLAAGQVVSGEFLFPVDKPSPTADPSLMAGSSVTPGRPVAFCLIIIALHCIRSS